MVRPGRDRLQGRVEVDEAYVGGASLEGNPGRSSERKVLVAVAVEVDEHGKVGRIRLKKVGSAGAEHLVPFIEEAIEQGSTIVTDGWSSYRGLSAKGYRHEVIVGKDTDPNALLPHVHTAASLLKRWLMGTLQGSCSSTHIEYYLDEYTFRYNRRKSKSRGLLFMRVLENAVKIEPVPYEKLVSHK